MKILKLFLTIFCTSISLQISFAQMSNAEIEKLAKEYNEELQKALNCDNLIKALDEQLNMYKQEPEAYRQLKPEIDQQKEEIRKNCVNGIYNPDGGLIQEDSVEEEPELTEKEQSLLDELKKMYEEGEDEVYETYDEEYSTFTRIPRSISFYLESTVTVENFADWMKSKYGVELKAITENSFQQTLDNIPLFGCTYGLLQRADGSIKTAYGLLHHAKRANPGKINSFQQILNQLKKTNPDIENSTDSSLIYIQKNFKSEDSTFYQCYTIFDDQIEYYVDVVNGTVIYQRKYKFNCYGDYVQENSEENIPSKNDCIQNLGEPANNPEIVNTYFYGRQQIETHYEQQQIFLLKSNRTKNAVMVVDSLIKSKPGGEQITSTNNKWLCYPTITGLMDAFISGEKTMQFYSSKLKRNSFDNKGTSLNIYFQPFEHDGKPHKNAYWDHRFNTIAYGHLKEKPASSIDVIAHEFTHGVVRSHCPSINYFGESGAIDEGISDILGVAAEKFAGMPYGDYWKILELQYSGKGRNIANPKSAEYPDTYKGNYFLDVEYCINTQKDKDECGVHTNSTIIGHWFYLLSNSKNGTNDLGNIFEVGGTLSYDEAVELVYTSIQQLTPKINFKEYSEITIKLAETKFGKTSPKTCTVKNAWYAVGVMADAPEKCVPGWTFTMMDQPLVKSIFYGKGDSVLILTIDKETGYHTKMYRNKESAYWKTVSETEDGITRMQIPNDIMKKSLGSKNMDKMMTLQNTVFEDVIRKGEETLKNPDLTAEERKTYIQQLQESKRIYEITKKEGQKVIDDLKESEKESNGSLLITEKSFWGHTDSLKKFDKMYLKKKIIYEGLKAKEYKTEGVNWTSTTEIPYGLGDIIFMFPGTKGNKKLGVDHFMRGFPLIINGEKIASDIKEYVPGNFDLMFSDAAVF